METTPYQRLEEFWTSKGLKNASAFADAIKRKAGTVSALKLRGSMPGNKLMLAIQQAFPDLNPDYILWNKGTMYLDGVRLSYSSTRDTPERDEEHVDMEPESDLTDKDRSSYWKGKYDALVKEQEKWEARESFYQELLRRKPKGNLLAAAEPAAPNTPISYTKIGFQTKAEQAQVEEEVECKVLELWPAQESAEVTPTYATVQKQG